MGKIIIAAIVAAGIFGGNAAYVQIDCQKSPPEAVQYCVKRSWISQIKELLSDGK